VLLSRLVVQVVGFELAGFSKERELERVGDNGILMGSSI